jgi:hypothetical protein
MPDRALSHNQSINLPPRAAQLFCLASEVLDEMVAESKYDAYGKPARVERSEQMTYKRSSSSFWSREILHRSNNLCISIDRSSL